MKYFYSYLIFFFIVINSSAQEALIFGRIQDNYGNVIEHVYISNSGNNNSYSSAKDGKYELYLPVNKEITVAFRHLAYQDTTFRIKLKPKEKRKIDLTLNIGESQLETVQIRAKYDDDFVRINPKIGFNVPSPIGGVESLIKTFSGVRSANELSSQYNVRGGNFDENLIYVNDIEIYRTFLIRSGQQEGLSFINLDLTASVKFSSGGFECQYGDKMSSVMDIEYKKPNGFASSLSASFLGCSLHTEGVITRKKEGQKRKYTDKLNLSDHDPYFSYLIGFRYKSNSYLLKTLNTKGDYKPNFLDLQTLLCWNINQHFEISFLGNLSHNQYIFAPTYNESSFGSLQSLKKLKVYYDGKEVDTYKNYLGALTFKHRINPKNQLRFIISSFLSQEQETFDIEGQYWLSDVEVNYDAENMEEETSSRGVGSYIDHARNYLQAIVSNVELKGEHKLPKNNRLMWGIKPQLEIINDEIKEWHLVDSSGYILPYYSTVPGVYVPLDDISRYIVIEDYLRHQNQLKTVRLSGFVQDSWTYGSDSTHKVILIGGVRFNYWAFNHEFVVSPRFSILFKPQWKSDWEFRFKTGIYYQPPFYNEMRRQDGTLNENIKSQRSFQIILCADYNFVMWRRPFKFTSELYYKYMDHVIPYEIDRLKLSYSAENSAKAFATGIDLKLSGEFVDGLESWISLSFLTTMEDIIGDFYTAYYDKEGNTTTTDLAVDSSIIYPGYVRRPTDQKFMINIFFQDHFPLLPQLRVHLNFLFGSPLPFWATHDSYKKTTYTSPWYRRVDLGFSYLILNPNRDRELAKNRALKIINSLSVHLEVFNIFNIKNVASYTWVKDINNVEWAVPNYLTGWLLNLKFLIEF